jgi:hypothetical protein
MNRARQYGSFARKPKHEGVAARPRQGSPGLLETTDERTAIRLLQGCGPIFLVQWQAGSTVPHHPHNTTSVLQKGACPNLGVASSFPLVGW